MSSRHEIDSIPTKPKKVRGKRKKSEGRGKKKSSDDKTWVWQYRDHNRFLNMDTKTSNLLEHGYKSGKTTVTLQIGKWTYDFNVQTCKQVNKMTTVQRPIRRVKAASDRAKKGSQSVKPKRRVQSHGLFSHGLRGGYDEDESDSEQEVIKVTDEDKEDEEAIEIWTSVELTDAMIKEEEQCRLCLCDFERGEKIGKLVKCNGHYFHDDCGLGKTIQDFIKEKKKCPLCAKFYGVLRGNQPSGRMVIRKFKQPIPGFDDTDTTVEIYFYMDGGVQNDTHPAPGVNYHPESRVAYLPGNEKGLKVLELFRKGWKQRLLFTVGYSETRQSDHVIIYYGIHMKTSPGGGSHGYPDDGYLDRVIDEFSAKGILF